MVTERVVRVLEVLDVQVLDHIVVGLNDERGWL
ncbi:hypothetical protein FM037_13605 [Shewanella psychropiezotolerans]|uniref:RadC-like JAB domain-containing protein n=1 Tax=Shewanella psychropiezotolerans TaxID=2593655 RepID=A0ABX5X5M8_9GAMM|nr:hypothetical protein FM037_13605 [Shewanella psychropiezotolerans]